MMGKMDLLDRYESLLRSQSALAIPRNALADRHGSFLGERRIEEYGYALG